MDKASLFLAAQKRVGVAFGVIPQQLEPPTESLLCVLLTCIEGEDHLEFNFDRSVFRQIRSLKDKLQFNSAELTALLVTCSASDSSNWTMSTNEKVTSVLKERRIEKILSDCAPALVCTLSEAEAATAWARPAVRLAIVGSFLLPTLDLPETHRCIFGTFVQADQRRCDSLCMQIAEDPPHTILKTQVADSIVSVLSSL